MRKGIVATITKFTFILLLGGCIFLIIEDYLVKSYTIADFISHLDEPPTFFEEYHDAIFIIIATLIFGTCFIGLGFHLNKKQQNNVKYWKFLVVGILVSFISCTLFYFGAVYKELFNQYGFFVSWDNFERDISKHFYVVPLYSAFLIIVCSIVAIFHKKYKTKKKFFNNDSNDSLDSNIVNNE